MVSFAVQKYGFKRIYFGVLIAEIILAASIYFLRKNTAFYSIWVCMSFFCQGTHFSCFPSGVNAIFGLSLGGLVFSFLVFAVSLSSFAGFLIVNFGGSNIPTLAVYIIAAVCAACALLLLIKFDETPFKVERGSQKQKQETLA